MWEQIKKDPLIKTIVVILLGVLAFGFAFNIMFGTGGSSMGEDSMMGGGYSLGNTLENVISILFKLVIIAILIGVLVWIFRTFTKQTDSWKLSQLGGLKEDPIIRIALILVGVVLLLIFGFYLFRGVISPGFGGEDMMNSGSGYMNWSFYSLLSFILKLFIFLLVLGLGFGLLMHVKEAYKITEVGKDNTTAPEMMTECPNCKAKIKSNWKCCPYCGGDKEAD